MDIIQSKKQKMLCVGVYFRCTGILLLFLEKGIYLRVNIAAKITFSEFVPNCKNTVSQSVMILFSLTDENFRRA